MTELATRPTDARAVLMPSNAGKDRRHRLGRFVDWLEDSGGDLYRPDLAAYRDKLLTDGLAPSSVAAHLSTVRGAYRAILTGKPGNETRAKLYDLAAVTLEELGQPNDPANRKAFVDETLARLENELDPATSKVTTTTKQDRPDSEHTRLTEGQANQLLAAPGVDSLEGLRDTALIALMLCTGIREAEAAALNVDDLRQRLGGELALHVKNGKGAKERLIPYGELSWSLRIVEAWLKVAGITSGAVFRSFWKGGSLRGRLTARNIQRIVKKYGRKLTVEGKALDLAPHDLRRTYARRLFDAGLEPVAIQQNLGHKSLKTTLEYIGTLDAASRRAPGVYQFDLTALDNLIA